MPDENKGGEDKGTTGRDMTVARLGAQRSKYRNQVKDLESANAGLKERLDRLEAENAELRTKADGSASAARVAELEQQIRERDHRSVFDKVAKARGVADDSLDLVYQLSGYKAEGDQPDESAIGTILDGAKAKPGLSRLFVQAETTTTETPAPVVKPGVASGQGGKAGEVSPTLEPGDPRHSDVKWVMRNYNQITQAAADRMARGEI